VKRAICHSAEPVLNLIKAAEAAQQRGDEFSANRYLIEATELAGSDNLLVEIARTRILLQQNKLPAARSSVDSLLEMSNRNKEVLKLAVDIYLRSKAYQALDEILDRVDNSGLLSTEEFHHIESVLKQLMDVKKGSDRDAIAQGIKALDTATQEFAARRMNASINKALTGKNLSDIEKP